MQLPLQGVKFDVPSVQVQLCAEPQYSSPVHAAQLLGAPPLPQAAFAVPGWQSPCASQHLLAGQANGQGLPQASSKLGSPQEYPHPVPGVQQKVPPSRAGAQLSVLAQL